MTPIIRIEHLTHRVTLPNNESLTILKDINLTVEEGASLSIVGTSGSGKTTLLSLMAGLEAPTSGEIWFANEPLHSHTEEQRTAIRKDNTAFVFQSFHLLPALTALENVMLPLEVMGWNNYEQDCRRWLTELGLKDRLDSFPSTLSGGEQQRVAIARAFAQNPKVLFADEPTGNLDIKTGSQIGEMLVSINKNQNTTLVMVTHDPAMAALCESQLSLTAGTAAQMSAKSTS